MSRLHIIVVFLLLFSSACGGGDDDAPADPDSGLPDSGLGDSGLPDSGLGDSALPDSGLPGCDSALDTDGDGLDDCRELELGTALHLADTDGDGFSDYDEVVELGFSPDNNNFKFNPLIADTPRIKVDITSPPAIALLYESSTGTELSHDVERSVSSSNAVTTGSASSTSHAVEWTETVGASMTVGVEVGFPTSSASAESTVSYESSVSTTEESSFEWSEEQTQENQQGLAEAQGLAESEGKSISGGVLAVTVDIENASDLAFTLDNLAINAYMSTPSAQQILSPVANLNYDTTQVAFPSFTYAPGQKNGPFVFLNDGLDTGTAEALVADSTNLHVNVVAYELTDENGRSFTHNQTAISAKTATVLIDYDSNTFAVDSERYQVATNVDPDRLRVTVQEVLENTLRIPFETNNSGALTGLRFVNEESETNGRWAVVHKSTDGVTDTIDLYSTRREPYDFAALELKSGDILHMVYIVDGDDDDLGRRQERSYGTREDLADTDGDGIDDGEEVNVTHTSPTHADTDADGINDYDEYYRYLTDPQDPDFNGNGIVDGDEMLSSISLLQAREYAAAVTARGVLYVWGNGNYGADTYTELPTIVDSSRTWVSVSVGLESLVAVDSKGDTYVYGSNANGRLGLGGAAEATTLTLQPGGHRWKVLATASDFTIAIADDDTLWGWGNNASSQLGTGGDTSTPVQLSTAAHVSAAAAGDSALVVRADGTLWGVGGNSDAELGLGDNTPRTTWTQVGSDTDWARVTMTVQRAMAVKSDGRLYAWGDGGGCPLGFATDDRADRTVPTQVGTDSDWSAIAAGYQHMLAVKTNGTLWGWGDTFDGQGGAFQTLWVPTQIGSDTDWLYVDAGVVSSVAVKTDYTAHSFGANHDGQLGRDAPAGCGSTSKCSADPGPMSFPAP